MCTNIYLFTRSTRYNSLPTYEKSIDEFCAFESLADARRFFNDYKNELVDVGYRSIGTRKQNLSGMVTMQTFYSDKQCLFVHLTIQKISFCSETPKL